jgi:hypothetical protein
VVTEQGGDTAAAAKRLGIPGAEIKRRLKDL